MPKQHAFYAEVQTIKELQQKISQGKKDLRDQQNQFQGIVEPYHLFCKSFVFDEPYALSRGLMLSQRFQIGPLWRLQVFDF